MGLAGLKPTLTPCVVVSRAPVPAKAFHKILSLPELLLGLLTVADARRRATQCAQGCSHEWHHLQDSCGNDEAL
jgi:hypothetical protein